MCRGMGREAKERRKEKRKKDRNGVLGRRGSRWPSNKREPAPRCQWRPSLRRHLLTWVGPLCCHAGGHLLMSFYTLPASSGRSLLPFPFSAVGTIQAVPLRGRKMGRHGARRRPMRAVGAPGRSVRPEQNVCVRACLGA